MIPFGMLFMSQGLRINEYGMRVVTLLLRDYSLPIRFLFFIVLHLVISWLAAIPLVLRLQRKTRRSWLIGAFYGALFYVVINSLLLPLTFGDPTPWQLGSAAILPSLTVHIIYGIAVALMASRSLKFQ